VDTDFRRFFDADFAGGREKRKSNIKNMERKSEMLKIKWAGSDILAAH
jgi:hypothetical protein